MSNIFRNITTATLLLFASLMQAVEIENPVWFQDWPDPTIWQGDDGRYYSVSTGLRRSIVSDDLIHWEPSNVAPVDAGSWQNMSIIAHNYWAPDVTMVGGKRMLYITLYNSAEDSNIGVLREFKPGQFQYIGLITRSRDTGIHDTIDPEVVTDPKTGKVWLFFGSIGGIHRVELTADGLQLAPNPRYEHVAGLTSRQCPDRSKVFEGAYLHFRKGYWYLFVSSGNYANHTYQLKVGRAKKLTDAFVDKDGLPMTEGNATPVLHSDKGDHFYGPGHCGEIFQMADGQDGIFYHCHVEGMRRRGARPMLLSVIQWDKEGWPFIEGGKPQ